MSTKHPQRPWYCSDSLVDAYREIEARGGNLTMLKHLKVVRAIVTNILVVGIAFYVVGSGADATVIGTTAISALALLNGIEVSEWIAAKQALEELDLEQRREK